MGIEAITGNSSGAELVPAGPAEWAQWVSAGATRNYLHEDPLLDWLELYGEQHGFVPDDKQPGYDERTDMLRFLFRKGTEFEEAVADYLRTKANIIRICSNANEIRNLDKAIETFEAMRDGVPIIYQGVLRDAETQTYGCPDLLVRSDILEDLFPGTLGPGSKTAAPDLPGPWHYLVVDIKFTTLHLQAGGNLGNNGSAKAYKGQLYIYNRALGRLQGYLAPCSYLLGRGWEQTVKGEKFRGSSAMERLAPVPQDETGKTGTLAERVKAAVNWVRRVRSEGKEWQVFPEPPVPELWPNMTANEDAPWHAAKAEIAEQLQELTLLWQVGPDKRDTAHAEGVYRWRDIRCTPTMVGISGEKRGRTLQLVMDVNRDESLAPVLPGRIDAGGNEWRSQEALQFYADFETVTDLNDDFSAFPKKGGQPFIFMIGCGHIENGDWQFSCFIADRLGGEPESRIIDAWLEHMETVRNRAGFRDSLIFHWSPAESAFLETAYNSAAERHPEKSWPKAPWFDFYKKVMKAEPVVVRGALGFGLKAVAKALHSHGLIETTWGTGPADGLGAMAGAWWCDEEAKRLGRRLTDIPLIGDIAAYNEVDCKAMMEIIRYLRTHH